VTRLVFVLQEPTPYRSPHLARLASKPGLDVTVVYAARTIQRRTWSSVDEQATYLTGPSLPLARILHHDYPLTPGVWPLLSRLRPDVVAIGGWSTSATQLALFWCRMHKTPYLLMSDNHLAEPRPDWVKVLKRLVLPRVVPQAAGWLVPGSLAREHLLVYGADPERIVEFPLTVDVPALIRQADALRSCRPKLRRGLGIPDDAVVVLSAGRLMELKAPDLLVRAVARASGLVDSPLHLVLAGEGPLESEVRAVAARESVNVTLTGLVEGEKLHDLYAAADVFALLSRRELWAVVVNEAMCFGLPLVLSEAVGSAADLLEPGGNGFTVPPEDVDAAAEAIARLARDPVTREAFGLRSRELIEPWGYDRGTTELTTLVRLITDAR
jgi:glycosyltransferase involved in cell wall biosynthesis